MKQLASWTWWKARPRLWFAYCILALTGTLGFFFFRILNWTQVIGKEKFHAARRKNGDRRNVIIASNHLTMFDSFIVGIIAFYPELIFYPSVAPYHLAAKENYFKYGVVRLILFCLRALPVAPGRKDAGVMQHVVSLLPKANVHVFPGGRRSYDPLGADPKHPLKGGLGYVVANAPDPKPIIIPVYIGGVQKIFGGAPGVADTARWFPRLTGIFRRPLVKFGDPVAWQDIIEDNGNTKEAWEKITRRIADSINALAPARAA